MSVHDRSAVRTIGWVTALLVLALVAAACSHPHASGDATGGASSTTGGTQPSPTTRPATTTRDRIRIEVLSSQPDRVTGGDARVRITPPRGVPAGAIRVTVDGRDVTGQLKEGGGRLEGVVSGFVEGTSTLRAAAAGDTVQQRIRDYPTEGPVISGPHLPLLACSTEGLGLGRPTDNACSAPTRVAYRYITSGHLLKDLPDRTARPADLASATINGRSVPLIVREEKGVINRAVYEIATIDPTPAGPDSDQSDAAWNRRLVYEFGPGCGTTFGQGIPPSVEDLTLLTEGYGLATATLNSFAVQCNDVLSAETALMVKERFIELFGVPVHTIGLGASGGAIQQHLIAQNYPGLLDGVAAILPFADIVTLESTVADCGLLDRYYATSAGSGLTPDQRAAIDGHVSAATCTSLDQALIGTINPFDGCDPAIPKASIYDPVTNRTGIRCTLQDANVNQLGRDPNMGYARRPLDNQGIQYGLGALNAGKISLAQFIALNAGIGAYDLDGRHIPTRVEAFADTVARTYATGRVATGSGDLTKIPIIDLNIYTDPTGDIHDRFRAFALRDRLVGRGSAEAAPGFQIWTRGRPGTSLADALSNPTTGGGYGPELVGTIDRWLDAIDRDRGPGTRIQKLRRDRPADAVDNCIDPATGARLGGVGIYDRPGPCRDTFPIHADPRIVAGAPRADDVIKCRLKPVDPTDYKVPLTSAQLTQLRNTFPRGVCDWRQGGVGQGPATLPGRTYGDENDPQSRI